MPPIQWHSFRYLPAIEYTIGHLALPDICSCPEPTTKLLAESIINFPMAHVFNIKLGFALFTVPIVKWQMMCNFYDCDLYISLMVCGGLKSYCDGGLRVICVAGVRKVFFYYST